MQLGSMPLAEAFLGQACASSRLPFHRAQADVLVVDDDPAIRRLIQAILEDEGYSVAVARDGAEGLELAAACSPAIVVLDLEMPVMDGASFYRALRARGDDTAVVISSAHGASTAKRELGADAAVEKPFEPYDLLHHVRRLIAR